MDARALTRWNAKVSRTSGCWLFTGCTKPDGYGRFFYEGKQALAHRVGYEHFVGPIPAGLSLDHLCRVRNCVNPAHLEPVTHAENVKRGIGPTAINATKTHCVHGHPFDEANTYIHPTRGDRTCRACRIISIRASNIRRRARLAATEYPPLLPCAGDEGAQHPPVPQRAAEL